MILRVDYLKFIYYQRYELYHLSIECFHVFLSNKDLICWSGQLKGSRKRQKWITLR